MKALYLILGLVLTWIGGTALYDDAKLYPSVTPIVVAALVTVFNAYNHRKVLEVVSSGIIIAIAAAYAVGLFHVGQAAGWAAGWAVLAGFVWVVSALLSPERQHEMVKAVMSRPRSKKVSATAPEESPFAPFDDVRRGVFEAQAKPVVTPPPPMQQPGEPVPAGA